MAAVVLWFAYPYLNPAVRGIPVGLDLGDDLSYLGTLRSELLEEGRLLTWWSVAYDGIPLLGHPLTQVFYPPLILPTLALGTAGGVRVAYVASLLLAAVGMYALARLLGPRPAVAAWAGLCYAMSGGLSARIHAGHLEKVLAMPFIPLVIGSALLIGRATSLWGVSLWAVVTGLLHGATFLAGESFLPIFLAVGVLIILATTAMVGDGVRPRDRLLLGLSGWVAGFVIATGGKLIASLPVLAETLRSVNPYAGSQHSYWAVVHLAFPFFRYVGLPRGGWEYTQYIGAIPVLLAALAIVAVFVPLRRYRHRLNLGFRPAEVVALVGLFVLAALWIANAFWYSPIHWLYVAVPGLQDFRVPNRALMLAAPAVLALGALGLEVVLRSDLFRRRAAIALLGVVTLGAVWAMNWSWFSPWDWLFGPLPGVEEPPAAARVLLLAVLATAALSGLGLLAFRWSPRYQPLLVPIVVSVVAVVALADLYHASRPTLKVGEAPVAPELRRVIQALQHREAGPFLVGLSRFGQYQDKSVRLEFADRGIAVARGVSPLEPQHERRHALIGDEYRIRYWVAPISQGPGRPGAWERLMEDGNVAVFVNAQAAGDAWLVADGEIRPLKVAGARPGGFVVQTSAPLGATLVVPANPFSGWRVSTDGGPSRPASEFDGYVAVETVPGEHTYQLFYRAPMLPLILVLGTLPWVVVMALLAWGFVFLVRRGMATTGLRG